LGGPDHFLLGSRRFDLPFFPPGREHAVSHSRDLRRKIWRARSCLVNVTSRSFLRFFSETSFTWSDHRSLSCRIRCSGVLDLIALFLLRRRNKVARTFIHSLSRALTHEEPETLAHEPSDTRKLESVFLETNTHYGRPQPIPSLTAPRKCPRSKYRNVLMSLGFLAASGVCIRPRSARDPFPAFSSVRFSPPVPQERSPTDIGPPFFFSLPSSEA